MFARILRKERKIKMKRKYLLGLLALFVVSCDADDTFRPKAVKALNDVSKPVNRQNEAGKIDKQYITNLIEFSQKFATDTIMDESKVFSPLSIYNCYAMLYEGTIDNVRKNMNEFFAYDNLNSLKNSVKSVMEMMSIKNKDTKLDTANSFWISDAYQDYMVEDYLDTLARYYYAEAFGGNLTSDAVKQDMANWINKKTRDMFNVKKDSFRTTPDTVLVLINTLYAKSPWLNEFEKENNYTDEFYSFTGSSSKTFMTNMATGYIYSGENFDVANLPMKETGLNLRILLPHQDAGIDTLKNNVKSILDLSSLTNEYYKISYKIPQFKITTKYDLKHELSEMGLTEPFKWTDDYTKLVDFQREDQLFCVTQSIHEAGIEVNNEGAKAAAYTTIVGDKVTATAPIELPTFYFNANRPFMYALTYNDIPLFLGTLLN